jgi:hypothetical protein
VRLANADIHESLCSVGGLGDTEELPASDIGDDQMLGVEDFRELEQFRRIDSRSGDEILEEQENAKTVCLHERGLAGDVMKIECTGICEVLREDLAYDSDQFGLLDVKEKNQQPDVYFLQIGRLRVRSRRVRLRNTARSRRHGP